MFSNSDLERIVAGEIDLAFRVWRRPMHTVGGRQRTRAGVVGFTSVEPVEAADLSEVDAARAGCTLDELEQFLARKEGTIYRIGLQFLGADERVALREQDRLAPDELDEIAGRLAGMDARSSRGPWTRQFLELIEARPAELAETIGASIGWDRAPFKVPVRRLKELGLTESLPTGYRLSPRGRAVLAHLRRQT
ncbi:ASCH domain-containing protein [Ornithinimicrobium sp. F0845]|uniref:ASCH domain-containing protein n=1 Tax=Ornithinimicrobium sp. F0845 TaxID=2926412 RepID=UPI001FF4E859|nr:ASCH domain-containing protein [Ornithinimicrobium sp. F0845]MCK0111929.1 ASCH domain-containing protein [Ornithinimicrobium sp. F0845]